MDLNTASRTLLPTPFTDTSANTWHRLTSFSTRSSEGSRLSILAVGPAHFSPRLVVFDKDGTLLDFHAMWATWIRALSQRIEVLAQRSLSRQLFAAALALPPFVSAIIGADDRLPIKPAADMLVHLCRVLAIDPAQAVHVGDTVADMQMARAAGVGLAVGVLSGLGTRETLAPLADALIDSVAGLLGA